MDSSSSPNTPLPNPSANEEEQDEEDEDILVQFDFEASMKAKNSLTTSNSITKTATQTSLKAQGVDEVPSETDKERLEAIKTKKENQSTVAFDMFAEDDEYETVSGVCCRAFFLIYSKMYSF